MTLTAFPLPGKKANPIADTSLTTVNTYDVRLTLKNCSTNELRIYMELVAEELAEKKKLLPRIGSNIVFMHGKAPITGRVIRVHKKNCTVFVCKTKQQLRVPYGDIKKALAA